MKLTPEQERLVRDAADRAYSDILGITGNSWQAAELMYSLAREAFIAGMKEVEHGAPH